MAEGFEPSIAALTVRCLTNLATPQKLAAAARVELASTRLQVERSGYPIELRRNLFGGPEGIQTLTGSLQDFHAVSYITSPKSGGCGWIRTTSLALMRRSLFPFELHSHSSWATDEHGWTRIGNLICADSRFYSCSSVALSAPLLPIDAIHHVAIVVHVHEEVLAPLGSRFCVVTKHNPFELNA